jgi:hypothetical protein
VRYLSLVCGFALGCSQSVAVPEPKEETTDALPSDGQPTGDDDDDTTEEPPQSNEAPIADAGDDLMALVAEEVELDGSASYDPDADELDFEWTFIDIPVGSGSTLLNESRPNPSFYADRPGVYVIELAVSDALSVSTDQVQVTVEAPNNGPVANAGVDQTVDVGDNVVLNGSLSYDPDGDPLDFQWTLSGVPGGSTAALDDPTSALPQFVADLQGVYVVELVVTDGSESSQPDEVRITAAAADDGDCLSCAAAQQELRRRARMGDYSGVGLLALLPIAALLMQRKRS